METEISVLSMQSYPCLIYFHHLWMPLVLNILAALNDCIHITKFQVLKEGIGQTFLPDNPQVFGNALGLFGKFGFSAFSSREKVYNAPVFPPWRGVAESQQHSLAYLASITCVRCLWTL